ncbi:hypothetical protein [Pseudobutyrivibrio sp. LB2011]|uniref:hypothetical protein n=1 Tax=Pseudobutyrivibrio sp. LB2011 TaxID=1408312 RepID=UPI0005D29D68|nr:hypothetical protein [Pseudobutyrivibrio sp. LB2011]
MSLKGELFAEVTGFVIYKVEDGLDHVPKVKEGLKKGVSKIDEKISNIDEEKIDYKINGIEERLESVERKIEDFGRKSIVEQAKALPHNYISNLLGNRDINKLLDENPQNKKLVAYGYKGGTMKTGLLLESWHIKGIVYDFYNNSGEKLYSSKGKESTVAKCYHIGILDSDENEIASVNEKLLAMRAPIVHENDPHSYSMEKNGRTIGEIKTAFKGIKLDKQYNIKIFGQKWSATRNVVNSRFKVFNQNKEQVLSINGVNSLQIRNLYVLDISPELEDDIALQLFSAMVASSHSNK